MKKLRDLAGSAHLEPQKLDEANMPHGTIETNTSCNIRCRWCYNSDAPQVKPFAQICEEIDLLVRRRRLDTISLLGGEPTIHPDLVDIVAYVKKQGLVCQILTNGVALLDDPQDQLLGRLVDAGVDRLLIHMDEGQTHVHGDIHAARHRLFERLERHRVCFGLAVTLPAGQESCLPSLLGAYAHYRYFDGIFGTLAIENASAFDPHRTGESDADMVKVHRSMRRELGILPGAYVPSNLDDESVCWLMYFYYLNVETGQTFDLSGRFNRGFRRLYRLIKGHEFFAETSSPAWLGWSLALTAAVELALDPRRLGRLVRLLQGARSTASLRFHYAVIQEPPRYNSEHARFELCWKCADVTPRRGKLTPVCIGSWVRPLDDEAPRAPADAIQTVYEHLGEPTLPQTPPQENP